MALLIPKILAQSSVDYKLGGQNFPNDNIDATTQFEKLLSQVIGVLTVFAVIYFVIQIIFGGYAYLSANGDPGKIEKANKQLTGNLLGLLIVIVAVGLGGLIAKLLGIDNPLDIQLMFTNLGL